MVGMSVTWIAKMFQTSSDQLAPILFMSFDWLVERSGEVRGQRYMKKIGATLWLSI